MMTPVRCFTCGREVAARHERFVALRAGGLDEAGALVAVGARLLCCRRMLISQPQQLSAAAYGRRDLKLGEEDAREDAGASAVGAADGGK